MRKLKDLPLKYQLVLMFFFISLISLWAASLAFISYDRQAYKKDMEKELTVLARIIAGQSASAVIKNDASSIQIHLDSLAIKPEIMYACVSNLRGATLASYRHAGYESIECLYNQAYISQFESDYFDLLQPIIGENANKIGELHIRQNLSSLNKRLAVFSVVMILIVVFVSIAVIMLSSRVQRLISSPIVDLTTLAESITQEKNYSLRANTERHDELGRLVASFNTMLDTIETQNSALFESRQNLEEQVDERTKELIAINRELEAFTYSVSHDLRAPLRSIVGFASALKEDYEQSLDETGKDYLSRILQASDLMATLINSLLYLSRVSQQEVNLQAVNLSILADEVMQSLQSEMPESKVEFLKPETLLAYGDKDLLLVVLQNLLGNALKYSSKVPAPKIELGSIMRGPEVVFFVRDNGVGFDMKYADRLFGPFQRLHRSEDFEGLGVGLATVARIVHRHGGEIWAEGVAGAGAVFYFTLGVRRE